MLELGTDRPSPGCSEQGMLTPSFETNGVTTLISHIFFSKT